MDSSINQANYIEWLKLVQKSYLVAYVCSFIILSHILTIDAATVDDLRSLPLFGVSLPRLPAVLFTLLIFWGSGALVLVSYAQLNKISKHLSPEVLSALRFHPSIGNSSWKLEAVWVLGLFVIFWVVFASGIKPKPIYESAWLALVVLAPYLTALLQKAFNKQLHRTP